MSLLLTLPTELLLRVLGELDCRSLLSCAETSRAFHALIYDTAELQYKIELAVSGCEDGAVSMLSYADKQNRLKTHQAAWHDLKWTSEQTTPMLVGGLWELYGGVLAQARGPDTLVFKRMKSELKGIEEQDWEFKVEPKMRDFGMDPSQNLLVVIEKPNGNGLYRVHLLQLSTGQSHDEAAKPGILSHSTEGFDYSFAIQVCGDRLSVLFIGHTMESENDLLVWNWKSGKTETHLHGRGLASFSFLTYEKLLVGLVDTDLQADEPESPPCLKVIDIRSTGDKKHDINSVPSDCVFKFPEMLDNAIAIALSIRSDPSPTWVPHDGLQVPFHLAHEDRLFVISLWVATAGGGAMTPLVLFVPSSTISSHLSNSVRGVDLSWEEWGPTGTRMRIAPSGHSAVWVCYVWGLKFVAPYRFGTNVFEHPRGPKMIQMFDFNQLSIRRAIANGETKEELEDGTSAIFTDATELKVPGVFQETIRTSLPFRWWSKKVPYHQRGAYESVMINEDAIVTVNSKSDIREYRILSF